jgi:hypothetical protein
MHGKGPQCGLWTRANAALPGLYMQFSEYRSHALASVARRVLLCSVRPCGAVQVLYPAMRRLMGDAAPDDCLDAHQTLKHKMARLADTHISDPNYDVLVADYMKVGRGFAAPLAYLPWSRAAAQQPACALLQSHSVAAAANTTCATCMFGCYAARAAGCRVFSD